MPDTLTAPAIPAPSIAFQLIPLAEISASVTNPRTHFDEVKLGELAENIKAIGVMQPLLVRPHPKPKNGARFEIVAGERRFRASKLAKLDAVPCTVRELDDKQVITMQVAENKQRQDLHPMEEAEGYDRMMKVHGYTSADPIAATLGISRTVIYGRLKLLDLCDEARKAFYADKLSASVAELLARIPTAALQKQAMKDLLGRHGDEPMSFRQAREFIHDEFMLSLKSAPFPIDDAGLVPGAGICRSCPKRTGNQRDLFSDVKNPDICTDTECFGLKRDAMAARRRAEAEARGQKVITGDDAKKALPYGAGSYMQGYAKPTERCWDDPKHRTYGELVGKSIDTTVLIEAHDTKELVQAIPLDKVRAALKEQGIGQRSKAQRNQLADLRNEEKIRRRMFEAIRAKAATVKPSVEDLRQIADGFCEAVYLEDDLCKLWDCNDPRKRIATMTPDECRLVLLDMCLLPEVRSAHQKPDNLTDTAKRLGVDIAQIRKDMTAEQKAKAAKKPKAKKPDTAVAGAIKEAKKKKTKAATKKKVKP